MHPGFVLSGFRVLTTWQKVWILNDALCARGLENWFGNCPDIDYICKNRNVMRLRGFFVLMLAVLAVAGCRCSGHSGEGSKGVGDVVVKSTFEKPLLKEVDWSKYDVDFDIRNPGYNTSSYIRVDLKDGGDKFFDEGLDRYDLVYVPFRGEEVLVMIHSVTDGRIEPLLDDDKALIICFPEGQRTDLIGEKIDWDSIRKSLNLTE